MIVILLGVRLPTTMEKFEGIIMEMESVLRELRREPCSVCRELHSVDAAELADLETWLRGRCAIVEEAIGHLTSIIEGSIWMNAGYKSVEAVRDHIARLERLVAWSKGDVLEASAAP